MFVTVKWLWRRPNAINSVRLRTDYWNADDSDDFTSECKEKKKTGLLRYMKWLNGVLAMLLVIEILLLWLHTLTCWWLYWNSWWCANNTELVYLLSQTYFNWGTKWLFDCRNKYIWKLSSICVICNTTCARLSRHWMDFLKT